MNDRCRNYFYAGVLPGGRELVRLSARSIGRNAEQSRIDRSAAASGVPEPRKDRSHVPQGFAIGAG